MTINVYLNFNGNCKEAVEFYAQVFNIEEPNIMTFGESPQNPDYPLPEEAKDLVLHANLEISGSLVMFSDVLPNMPFVAGNNVSLAIVHKDKEELISYFNQLKEGGKVFMELQETFWSKLYGGVTDKFGIEWQFNWDNGEMFPYK